MKIKFFISAILLTVLSALTDATTVVIHNDGNTFVPDEVTVQPGDTIYFNIGTWHNVVEVSEETWIAGDTNSNGGFRLPFGGGKIVLDTVGTYYYVCQPHASLGMKGIIHLEIPSVLQENESVDDFLFSGYPNPVSDLLNLNITVQKDSHVSIDLKDMSGRTLGPLVRNEYTTGNYNITIPVGFLESGRYLLLINTGTEIKTFPFVKL
jgi:plastocyanin